jgi:excinuclease ABC subunit C
VPGLGEHRRKALVTHFGSLARLREATVEEITTVPGVGAATARAVVDALRQHDAGTTGPQAAAANDPLTERALG